MRCQGGPELPLDGIAAETDKGAQLQRLLDLLEEYLDGPAAAVEVADGACRPFKVVGEECHLLLRAVGGPHPGPYEAQAAGIEPAALIGVQFHLIVADDVAPAPVPDFPLRIEAGVVLGPCDPEYSALIERVEMSVRDVCLVEYGNFIPLHSSTMKRESWCFAGSETMRTGRNEAASRLM